MGTEHEDRLRRVSDMLGDDVAVTAGGGAEDRPFRETAAVHIVVDAGGRALHKFQVAAKRKLIILRFADEDVGGFQIGMIVFGFKNKITPVREICDEILPDRIGTGEQDEDVLFLHKKLLSSIHSTYVYTISR